MLEINKRAVNERRKILRGGEKRTGYCLNIISTFGAIIFLCCASLLKLDSKAKTLPGI